MDLFEYVREKNLEKEAPLASRLRPTTLEEVVGQQHIIGKDKLLYRAIKADKLSSIIFYGPPGTGKTTLAKVIAHTTSAEFKQINATVAGKKDMEDVIKKAQDLKGMYQKKTILFVDEIHRFNKGQQDYLLPFVEDGTIILIGATTENPYFEVNSALISRSSIFELKPLSKEDIKKLLERAVYDVEKGMGSYGAVIDEEALDFLADVAGGTGFTVILPMLKFLGCLLVGDVIQFLIYGPFTAAFCGVSPAKMPKKYSKMSMMAVTTTSSAICLPPKMEDMVTKFGVDRKVSDFVGPITMSMNSCGAVQCYVLAMLFMSQATGRTFTMSQFAMTILLACLMCMGTIVVPGGMVVTYTFFAATMGLPTEAVAILIGIDWFSGMFRTLMNVDVDVMVGMIVSKVCGVFDKEVYDEKKTVSYENR